ncbi:MAG: FeoB small GTPase domain-containing protein [Deinococcaceae bacterium]
MKHSSLACETCALNSSSTLKRLGTQDTKADFTLALAGNPNTGKSTVFNALTGLRQHVGNWSGKTVARAEGSYTYKGSTYKLVDLPGTYSLLSTSTDEEIARDFILFAQPDVTLIVVDATRLERNLNLTLQILEITDQAVLALNLMDEAKRHGLDIDDRHLSRRLGIPVVPLSARQGIGLPQLLETVANVAQRTVKTNPYRTKMKNRNLEKAVSALSVQLAEAFPGLPNTRWIALRLLEGDANVEAALLDGTFSQLIARPNTVQPQVLGVS